MQLLSSWLSVVSLASWGSDAIRRACKLCIFHADKMFCLWLPRGVCSWAVRSSWLQSDSLLPSPSKTWHPAVGWSCRWSCKPVTLFLVLRPGSLIHIPKVEELQQSLAQAAPDEFSWVMSFSCPPSQQHPGIVLLRSGTDCLKHGSLHWEDACESC